MPSPSSCNPFPESTSCTAFAGLVGARPDSAALVTLRAMKALTAPTLD
jgi:hypothetical protein